MNLIKMWGITLIVFYNYESQLPARTHLRDPFQTVEHHDKKKTQARKKRVTIEKVIQLLGITHVHTTYGALVSINKTIETVTEGDRIDTFYVASITSATLTLRQGKKEKILTITSD